MNLKDKIAAAKAAKAAAPVALCRHCAVNVVEHAGAVCAECVATAKGAGVPSSGLVLKGAASTEPGGLAATSMVHGRQLGFTASGEHVPLKFESDGLDPRWSQLAHHFETDLCLVVHADNQQYGWLAIRAKEQHGPLLIHKLPLCRMNNDEPPF